MGVRVETQHGALEGVEERGVRVFRGIPYAAPPVGTHRLRPPRPAPAWAGVRDATRFGPSAPQDEQRSMAFARMGVGPQSEDCLYLNVYAPADAGAPRPVLVWLHGGAFLNGSGSQAMYRGHALVRRGDVVVVTLNYRLGALGFLHLAELSEDPRLADAGSCGLLDQIAALRWVRENIAAFGGNAAKVTIFGESAGGMSVGTLLGTPAARGLFQRAIAQSGAALHVHHASAATRVARVLLEEAGLSHPSAAELQALPLAQIQRAQARTLERLANASTALTFQPVIDGRTLPQSPLSAVNAGAAAGIPLLIGTTRDEWSFWAVGDPRLVQLDESGLLQRVRARVPRSLPESERAPAARDLIELYRSRLAGRCASPRDIFVALQTDRVFGIPARQLAEAQSRHEPRTWAYRITWESPAAGGALGACHGIDIPFVFGMIGSKGVDLFAGDGPDAERLQGQIMDAWLRFARSGGPRHDGLPEWPAFEPNRAATMLLGAKCELVLEPERRPG
ncbi:MAG: carboxylesterase/lipase family protein [Myxococcota bacterium]